MQIYDTKVNHLSNPLGYQMNRTVFSWKVKGAEGTFPSAARILIAAEEDMKNILFDSGYDEKADSLGYPVNIPLAPRTRYFWTVSVKTNAGEKAVSEVQWFETSKREEPWTGKWITCDNNEKRHPFFEKEIAPSKKVTSARLYLCGLGLYEAYYQIAGKNQEECRIGEEYLTPYSNDYDQWVQYQTFDVTNMVQHPGKLRILLGNGWYKARFGFTAFEDKGFYGDSWKLIAELHLVYEDGSSEIIGTDDSWTVTRSKITFSNLYDGEHRDDTLPELPVQQAFLCDPPKGELTERLSLPVTVHEIFSPAELIHTPAGESVFDMGQEFTGIFSLRVCEPAGTVIHIQTGEILQQDNFYNENLRTAKSEYFYTSDGKEHIIRPHFTFYGYRYVKIQGVTELKKEDFLGMALYSDMEWTGEVTTGHGAVNRLIENVRWGMKSNFLDVPTDCPQRDERMGWTGDAQVFSPTAMYLADTYAFYRKYLYDMAKEQIPLGGKVPDVIPSSGVESTACVWGDACCIIPWNLYLFHGDKSILRDQFGSMKSWVDYIRKIDGNDHGWREVYHYGDWLALDNPQGGAEQVLGATDEEFIANLYYAVSAGIVAKAAAVLGYESEEEYYRKLSEEQFSIVKNDYYSNTGRCCIKTQTALLLTLKYHLSDHEELTVKMLKKLFADSGYKLKTGFVGTPLMNHVLSEYGMDDIAFHLLLNEEYPGWLYEVKLGATTIWERWNSLLEDGTISGIGMNSMNHYSYGSVLEWIFRHVAGINNVEDVPGFRQVSFAPSLNWELRKAAASYDSPSGRYACSWELTDREHVELKVSVPFGCTAMLKLPLAPQDVFGDQINPMFADVRDGICYLNPGDYTVSYRLSRPMKKTYSIDSTVNELYANPEISARLEGVITMITIPDRYFNYSLRDVSKKFETRITPEQLEQVTEILKEFS
ncbi:MAG: family 78 glycoside hydrolase catalytic domain [Eubacteriales bacterium]|nr:family 78 glycoside hydrolase catalytic domain [Eubacteriales bacterium]